MPIIASKIYHREAGSREIAWQGASAIVAAYKNPRKFRKAWIVSNNQQGLNGSGRLGQEVVQGFNVGVVEGRFDLACRHFRQFLQNCIERVTRAARWRRKGKVGSQTRFTKISAHSGGIGAALKTQPPPQVSFGSVSYSFGMADEEELRHRAVEAQRKAKRALRITHGPAKKRRRKLSSICLAIAPDRSRSHKLQNAFDVE